MLNGKLRLYDIDDTESWCASIINRSALELSRQDREECLTFLIEATWELSLAFDPRTSRKFSRHATNIVTRRLVDWRRQRNGRTRWQFKDRTYERILPSFIPYEDRPDGFDHSLLDHTDSGGAADVFGLQRARGSEGARPDPQGSGAAVDRAA